MINISSVLIQEYMVLILILFHLENVQLQFKQLSLDYLNRC